MTLDEEEANNSKKGGACLLCIQLRPFAGLLRVCEMALTVLNCFSVSLLGMAESAWIRIESMNSFEIQCITEGLQIDKAGLRTTIESQLDKKNDFYEKTGMTLASQLASSISCALFWIKWCWLGMWGKGVRPDTEYDLAMQLNSETVNK